MNRIPDDQPIMDGSGVETMNAKIGGFGSAIVVGIVVGVVPIIITRSLDRAADTSTATAITRLQDQVATLSEQVKQLTEQPYVRRGEFEGRLSGLEQRIGELERAQQSRR